MPDLTPPFDPARDHARGDASAPTLLVFGDYECPYTRMAYRAVQQLEPRLALRFAFRHFPLSEIHPHAAGAAAAAEAAAAQGRFWPMHDLLFHRQKALSEPDLRSYAAEVGLDLERYDRDLAAAEGTERVLADLRSGLESGVRGTPTLFVDGALHRGSYEPEALEAALAR
jgi:protein-disulfide isomerase